MDSFFSHIYQEVLFDNAFSALIDKDEATVAVSIDAVSVLCFIGSR